MMARLAHAKRLGAESTANARLSDVVEQVKKITDGGAHGVLITAPSLPAFKQGVGMTRKWGTCVLVGIPPGDYPTPLFDVVANCITIRGSFVGSQSDMGKLWPLVPVGWSKPTLNCNLWRPSTRWWNV